METLTGVEGRCKKVYLLPVKNLRFFTKIDSKIEGFGYSKILVLKNFVRKEILRKICQLSSVVRAVK